MAEDKNTHSNLNTILLAISIAVLGWIGITVSATSVAVARVEERLNAIDHRVSNLERIRAGAGQVMSQGSYQPNSSSP